MASLLRTVARTQIPRTANVYGRRASSELVGKDMIAERRRGEAHAVGSGELWRKITYYVAFPAIILIAINTWNLEKAHEAHMAAIIEENGGERPERLVYDYMNVRRRGYPWGNQSLFFSEEHNIRVE